MEKQPLLSEQRSLQPPPQSNAYEQRPRGFTASLRAHGAKASRFYRRARDFTATTAGLYAALVAVSLTLGVLVSVAIFLVRLLQGRDERRANEGLRPIRPVIQWDDLPWNTDLQWVPCYGGGLQCARLEVPMDYWNGTTDAKVGLAVLKLPAVVPVTDERYAGPILLNPGGPGGSGVGFLLRGGSQIRSIVEPWSHNSLKHFDLLSFDPRGVANSEPPISCFQSESLDHSFEIRINEEGVFSSSDAVFGRLWSMSAARGGSCSLPVDSPDIKQYVSTASVATDMVSIIEAHGRWREKEAVRLLGGRAKVPEKLKHKSGHEKLQYMGFSYGTYLGATFSAMYPDKVGRVMIDGVVDAYDYRMTLWYDNLVDTEKDFDQFYSNCARVGYPTCRLANLEGKTTAAGVKNRTMAILQSLYHDPLPVIDVDPEIITYSDIKNLILGVLYAPVPGFPLLADLLADIEDGDGTVLAMFLKAQHDYQCPSLPPSRSPSYKPKDSLLNHYASMAIACSDGDEQGYVTKELFRKHIRKEEKLSPTIGEIWATLRLMCIHYKVRAQHRFTEPWRANTSHPLLIIGNTADPVTPLDAAKKMSKGFPGSVVLTQDSPGHCSLAAFSKCTHKYISQFFQTGELPPKDTVCGVQDIPFGPGPDADDEGLEIYEQSTQLAHLRAAVHESASPFLKLPDIEGLVEQYALLKEMQW